WSGRSGCAAAVPPPQDTPSDSLIGRGSTVLSSILRRSKPVQSPNRSRPACQARPSLQSLEDRVTPYVLSGFQWANSNISASFMPDGTQLLGGYTSSLFATLNPTAPTLTWQREFARALQTWAQYAPLNFHIVPDDGTQQATFGPIQGDPRFGDI